MNKLFKKIANLNINYKESFSLFDVDNEEIIDFDQMLMQCLRINLRINKIELTYLFRAIDTNDSGAISKEEWVEFMTNHFKKVEDTKKEKDKKYQFKVQL